MTKVFDFNVHLPYIWDSDVNKVIENDMNLVEEGLVKGVAFHEKALSELSGANFLLFNTDLFSENVEAFKSAAAQRCAYVSMTVLIDFRRPDIKTYLDQVAAAGGRFVMVNSYLQQIGRVDYTKVIDAFVHAASLGLYICIDGSYGTSRMFAYDNIELACEVAEEISEVPIVIIHSGGLRVLQAMLLALDKENVWLDTSFSLPYYLGSSLEADFAFAYKNMGCKRVVYGSDIPYLNSDKAVELHLDFFKRHQFSEEQVTQIMCSNALELLGLPNS